MAVYPFATGTYARNIYLYGTKRFYNIPTEYHQPVKQHAADTFMRVEIDEALLKGYITEQEYDETVILITKEVIYPTLAPTN